MTRQRDGKSDWRTLPLGERTRTMVTLKALAQGTQALTPEERAVMDAPPKPRGRPVQHEDAHARMLAVRAWRHWWGPGLRRIEHRTQNEHERDERARQGATEGMPDFWLFVPEWREDDGRHIAPLWHKPILAVCELKAPQHCPKGPMPDQWWLGDWPGEQQTWHALRRAQWRELRMLHACGFETCVAYGADQAEAFFVRCAGPRPDALPEEWV